MLENLCKIQEPCNDNSMSLSMCGKLRSLSLARLHLKPKHNALNDFCNRWCKRESVECNAMKEWKLSIFNIMDKQIKFYSQNTNLFPPKPKSSFRHLKQGIQEFHRKYVLVPADKAANNIVVVFRLHYINTLKQELNGT